MPGKAAVPSVQQSEHKTADPEDGGLEMLVERGDGLRSHNLGCWWRAGGAESLPCAPGAQPFPFDS